MNRKSDDKIQFVYDKECPVCNHFATHIGRCDNTVDLVNAREDSALLDAAAGEKLNIDDGAIVYAEGQMLFGVDAVEYLAKRTKHKGILGVIFTSLFRFKLLASLFYPVLVFARKALLKILGKSLINDSKSDVSFRLKNNSYNKKQKG